MNSEQLACANSAVEKSEAKQQRFVRPQYTIESEDHRHILKVIAPGATKESVSITREKDSLLITASRLNHYADSWKAISREILDADYRLRLQLNVAINDEAISAKLENGILEVVLPVAEEAKPRKIAIS